MRFVSIFFSFIVMFSFLDLLSAASINVKDEQFSAKIERDEWGVPHIYGKRDSDVSFGLAYAHAQDDFQTLEGVILALRGELASVYGRDAAVNDYYVHLMNFWNTVEERYESDVPDDVKLLCEGYAAGFNLFLEDNPTLPSTEISSVTGRDIIAGFSHKMPLMFGLDGVLKKLSKDTAPVSIGFGDHNKSRSFDMVASNVIAVGPQRSSDGYTRIWINSHQPWDGPVAWYEAHLVSEEGWDFYGALFPGSPVPLVGHNKDLGWSHTVNSPDLVDVYKLTINKLNENQYWFEGYWKDLKVRTVDIKVKLFGPFSWTFKREVKESIHGPVIEFDHGVYSLRISSLKDLRFLEQWYRMGKASNFSEFHSAMKIHAIPMFNTGYADKDGIIYHVYNAKIPKRDPRYNWRKVLPGETKQTLWYEYVPFDKLPQVYDPLEGFIQNCNSNPYLATGSRVDASKPLPEWAGIEKHQTNRALRALETFGIDPSITRDEFFEYKYDVEYSRESILAGVRKRYLQDMKDQSDPKIQQALDLLKGWNLRADSTNTAAALALIVLPNAFKIDDLKYDKQKITNDLYSTMGYLENKFGRIDVPLGRVLRLIRGDTNLPLSGGPGLLRAIYFKKKNDQYQGIAGDCYFQAVEWGPEGQMNAWSIHQYGSATSNKDSKHYDDQAKLFSKHEMKQIRE